MKHGDIIDLQHNTTCVCCDYGCSPTPLLNVTRNETVSLKPYSFVMETGIDHIDSLLEKRSSFHFTWENTAELKDSSEGLLPISNYDPLSIKGFDVPQIYTQKSIQGFIADIKVRKFSGSLPPTK